jgi:hypothetical protein
MDGGRSPRRSIINWYVDTTCMPGARVASGERVTLRTAEEEDAAFLQRAHANPELRYPLGWDVKSRDEIAADIEDNIGHDELHSSLAKHRTA